MRITLALAQREASKRSLILEKVGRVYEITDNSQGVTEVCDNLVEVWSAIHHWN